MICDRCGREALAYTTSWFNTETICLDCAERERRHPEYAAAREAENEAVQRGDYNFPGTGLPTDLREEVEAEAWARRVDLDTLAAMLSARTGSAYYAAAKREWDRREEEEWKRSKTHG